MKKQKQKNNPKDRNKKIAEYIFLFLIAALVIWYIFFIPHNTTPTPTPQAWKWLKDDSACDALACVKVDSTEFNSTYGYGHIYGRAINNSGKDFSYIAVNFGLYDGDVKTGSCIANQNYLSNGTTWSFEAVCTGTSGASYKVENVTYY